MTSKTWLENDYKRLFMKEWSGWACRTEPGLGADTGIPDVLVLWGAVFMSRPLLIPIEFKKGRMSVAGHIITEKVRPAQVGWNREFTEAGGISLLLIGLHKGGVPHMYVVDAKHIMLWGQGFLEHQFVKLWPSKHSLVRSFGEALVKMGHIRSDEIV